MPSIAFSLLGARAHYFPMVMAEEAGCLGCLVTDQWHSSGRMIGRFATAFGMSLLGRFAGRFDPSIPSHKVRALTRLGFQYKWMCSRANTRRELYEVYEYMGSRFAREASRFLSDQYDTFFGYTSASLETLQHASRMGLITVLDQIDPGRALYEAIAEEQRRFGGPETVEPMPGERYFARIDEEWDAASAIVVNSQYCKQCLIRQGAPEDKLFVLPIAFRRSSSGTVREPWLKELRVLWLGTLNLGKGLAYAIEAAQKLFHAPVRFTFAGPCEVRSSDLRFPPNARYIGAVPRSDVAQLYSEHDVFLFPTLSDGFGLTQVEALANGLPVIATRNCGDVVEDGISGFLIQTRDSSALADAILRFVEEPDLLPAMSSAALRRSKDFEPARVWSGYADVLLRGVTTSELTV